MKKVLLPLLFCSCNTYKQANSIDYSEGILIKKPERTNRGIKATFVTYSGDTLVRHYVGGRIDWVVGNCYKILK